MNTTRTTTRRNRSLLAAAAATLLLPGLLAACSGSTPGGDAASTADTAAKGPSLAECMRDKGYDMPDPGSGSGLQLSAPDGVDEEQYQGDLRSCLDDTAGAGDARVAEQIPGDDDRTLRTAECIREQGFSDYPDDEDGKIRYQPDDQEAFDEVARACDAEAAESAGAGVAR